MQSTLAPGRTHYLLLPWLAAQQEEPHLTAERSAKRAPCLEMARPLAAGIRTQGPYLFSLRAVR